MKSKNVFKLFLDFTMIILFLLLFLLPSANSFFHEVAGIVLGVLFVLHIAVNIKMIKRLWNSMAAGNISNKSAINLFFDLLLIACMFIVVVTGLLISEVLIDINIGTAWMLTYQIHNVFAYICMGILALHILLHAIYLKAVIKQTWRNRRDVDIRKITGRFTAALFVAGLLYLIVFISYKNNINATNYNEDNSVSSETQIKQSSEEVASEVSSSASYVSSDSVVSKITLTEYLSKLFCTGCSKHCPLSAPQCGRSAQQIQEATKDYNDLYTE